MQGPHAASSLQRLVGAEDTLGAEGGGHEPVGGLLVGALLLDRPGELTEVVTQLDVDQVEEALGRREVVGRHGRQAQLAVVGRRDDGAGVVVLEPHDGRPEDPALAQVVAHPRLDDAQILPDEDRAGPVRLEREDPDEGLVVVAHVGASRGLLVLRDPPQPEEADDVVDADAPGVGEDRAHHVAVGPVPGLREAGGVPRRLAPVLALLGELVRRRADGDTAGEDVGQRPGVGPLGVHPHGEVVKDPQSHPGVGGGGLRGAELLVREELEPQVQVDPVGVLERELLDGRRRR